MCGDRGGRVCLWTGMPRPDLSFSAKGFCPTQLAIRLACVGEMGEGMKEILTETPVNGPITSICVCVCVKKKRAVGTGPDDGPNARVRLPQTRGGEGIATPPSPRISQSLTQGRRGFRPSDKAGLAGH
jgi:hypothetical protein